MNSIIRFGVSIDEKLLKWFDDTISDKGYINRSEAIRDLIRNMMVNQDVADPEAYAVGTLTIVYSHDVRELSDKLNDIQHHNHQIIVSTVHIHLDEHNCLEVLILKGKTKEIQGISDRLLAVKNVIHGRLTISAIEKILVKKD